jgi:hypothetical protein
MVFNITNTGTGTGIFGQGGINGGVFGKTSSTTGRGVLGLSHTSGTGYGVDGQSGSPEGTGVRGIASNASGTNYGVKGITNSASGFSGHFTGGKFHVEGNVGIGTENPSAKLEVAGQIKITGGSPGEGKLLTSDNNGTASWKNGIWIANDDYIWGPVQPPEWSLPPTGM